MDVLQRREILQSIELCPCEEDDNAGCAEQFVLPETVGDERWPAVLLLPSHPEDKRRQKDDGYREENDDVRL